jgi:hypothetical protein
MANRNSEKRVTVGAVRASIGEATELFFFGKTSRVALLHASEPTVGPVAR